MRMTLETGRPRRDDAQPALPAERLWPAVGALWAFFGLALLSLLKDVALSDRLARLQGGTPHAAFMVAVVAFMAVNFATVAVIQTTAVMRFTQGFSRRLRLWLRFGSALLLLGHLTISVSACVLLNAAITAAPPEPEPSIAPGHGPPRA